VTTSSIRRFCGAAAAALLASTATAQTPPGDRSAKHPGLASVKVDLAVVDRIVGAHQVLVFGEDSHEMAAEHDAVRQIFEHLATTKGFRLLVFESQWGVEDKLRDFMASDRTTLTDEERFFLDGAFASKSTAELLVWIRNFNRTHPKDQIRIAGFQPEQPVTDFQAVWAFLAKASPERLERLQGLAAPCRAGDPKLKVDFDFMNEGFKRQKQKLPVFTAEERQACLTALASIRADLQGRRAALAARTSPAEVEEAILHLDSFRYYVDGIRRIADEIVAHPEAPFAQQTAWQHDAYQTGDANRMAVFRVLLKTRYAGRKAMFWMHNWHAAKHGSELGLSTPDSPGIPAGTTTIGERLASYFGPRLVAIASVVPCGKTCAEPADSLEPAFAKLFGDRSAVVDLHHPTPAERAALPLHQRGSFFANFHGFGGGGLVLDRQFDGVLYILSSTTTQPG
jgi:erythromycin esterase-like protein